MNITLLPGRLIVMKDPVEDRNPHGVIWYPDVEHRYADQATCLLHEPSDFWLWAEGACLSGRRIVFSKWTGKDFEWNGTTLTVLKESSVLATLE